MGIPVLLVDDNPGDIELTKEAFAAIGIEASFLTASDGIEAMRLLRARSGAGPQPLPAVILLDLNMPHMSGWELLSALKRESAFTTIPAVVLTDFASPMERQQSQRMGACECWQKPARFKDLVDLVRRLLPLFPATSR